MRLASAIALACCFLRLDGSIVTTFRGGRAATLGVMGCGGVHYPSCRIESQSCHCEHFQSATENILQAASRSLGGYSQHHEAISGQNAVPSSRTWQRQNIGLPPLPSALFRGDAHLEAF